MDRINVVKSILPDEDTFFTLMREVLGSNILTNNGVKCQMLSNELAKFINAKYLLLCANGTLGLEIAIHAAKAAGKTIITTPFTYVATATAALWVGCKVVFADINPETLCINPKSIAERMSVETAAVIPVNIYGYPCDDAGIRAACGDIPVIYDAAQAFGAAYKGQSLLNFGDLAVCSLHATKVFHSGEGGFVVCHTPKIARELSLLRAFGHEGDNYITVGINAKMSELHASMGLAILKKFSEQLEKRKNIDMLYRSLLKTEKIRFPVTPPEFQSNYGYFPVIFQTEKLLQKAMGALRKINVHPRRYFFPALSTLPYLNAYALACPVAEDIAKRILCLPFTAICRRLWRSKLRKLLIKRSNLALMPAVLK